MSGVDDQKFAEGRHSKGAVNSWSAMCKVCRSYGCRTRQNWSGEWVIVCRNGHSAEGSRIYLNWALG